jgi:UDP-glucose 4-epimerase
MNSGFPYRKAVVTGGAGFIGSHIVEALVDLGVEVLSIDNYLAGKHENLEHLSGRPNFREIECDVTDRETLEQYFEGVEVVFHNAASKKTVCLRDPRRDLEINAEGTFNMLELSRAYGVKKFVHASTGSVYGEAIYFPQDEKHSLVPTSFYGVSKLAGEKYVKVFNHLYDLNTTVLRYFHVYGPRQESSDYGGVVAIFIRRLLNDQYPIIFGDGTQQRSFTYVKDVVRANLHVAAMPDAKGEIYNCASGIQVTINELAQMLLHLMHKEHLQPVYEGWQLGDIKVFDVDNSKLRATGYEFKMDFEEGLRQTLAAYQKLLGKNQATGEETAGNA